MAHAFRPFRVNGWLDHSSSIGSLGQVASSLTRRRLHFYNVARLAVAAIAKQIACLSTL